MSLHPIQPIPAELLATMRMARAVPSLGSDSELAVAMAAVASVPSGSCTALSYYKSVKLSANAAAGIVGNLIQESTMNPNAGKGTAHQGLAQWSPSRWKTLTAYAKKHNKNPWGLSFQIDYVIVEMKASYDSTFNYLMTKGITVDSATNRVFVYYEGAGDSTLQKRINYAKAALKQCH